ncbi:MAG: hypothetical protein L3J05_07565, partial [Robiginitomaculum sp.]|nr:hypothetical protein [Robiginitomaculum sp.]
MKILPNIQGPNRHLSTDPLYSEIAECYDYAALENTLLGSLARDIGADTSALMHFQKNTDGYTIGHHQAHGVGNDIHSQYVKKFHRSDPVILNRISTSRTTAPIDALTDVYRLSDVCNSKDFVKTGYYNEFLKPSGIRHVLALA